MIVRRISRAVTLLAVLAAGLAASGTASASGTLSLVAYSTPREAYEAIIPAFTATPAGRGTRFQQSYGSSGEQSRAVENGLPADVVALSLEPDVTRLVTAGLIDPNWNRGPYRGFVSRSVVTFVVRKGNPKRIRTWDDLVRPGVQVLIPNWQTSGGAKWNILAAYGAQKLLGRNDQQATDYLKALYRNVVVQDKSAREALNTFAAGKGDVLISYENEAIAGRREGIALDYVTPAQTILIENPVAVLQTSRNLPTARAFVAFLTTPRVQAFFAVKGYRPVDPRIAKKYARLFPRPAQLFTISTFGGWAAANRFFFSANGVAAQAQRG